MPAIIKDGRGRKGWPARPSLRAATGEAESSRGESKALGLFKWHVLKHAVALALVLGLCGALELFRLLYVEPRVWVGLCAAPSPPWVCLPRGWLLWLQYEGAWGLAGFLLGLAAFWAAPLAVAAAAVALGIAGVINYNATWGLLGAALGVWRWMTIMREQFAASVPAASVLPATGATATARQAQEQPGSRSSPQGSSAPR